MSPMIDVDRSDIMVFNVDMEQLEDTGIRSMVLHHRAGYRPSDYTAADVRAVLDADRCNIDGFKVLLSPAAEPFLEEIALRAQQVTARYFGNTIQLFTPLYLDNHCQNFCLYCGFGAGQKIARQHLNKDRMMAEMEAVAASGMEEILLLTGESRRHVPVSYLAEACQMATRYFRTVGLEVYPMNTDDYRVLHDAGVDYVTVFQETYDIARYGDFHPGGPKRIFPYRFEAQERALRAGMRGVAFGALFGLADVRADALATGLHAYFIQRRYPHAEISLSCPRLRPIAGASMTFPHIEVDERTLLQIICAYRIFLPFAGITVSTRESARFRDGVAQIAATKLSAGVSTGVGDHSAKDTEVIADTRGDAQFEIQDNRSLAEMYAAVSARGLQPVLNDYIGV